MGRGTRDALPRAPHLHRRSDPGRNAVGCRLIDGRQIQAPESLEQMAEVGRRAPRPIVANMIEHGKTPVLPRDRLVALGFQLILYPLSGVFAAARALERIYQQLHAAQTTAGAEKELMAFTSFNDLIGVEEKYRLAERFGVRD